MSARVKPFIPPQDYLAPERTDGIKLRRRLCFDAINSNKPLSHD